ncbi:MAG: type I methionyl aminopeptidase [Patescibacteria group bacterium]|nr:type I methionyl aminopeptidase [Patescibacteria group bacterium]
MIVTTPQERKDLHAAGIILSSILEDLSAQVREGTSAAALDLFAESAIRTHGATPAFLGYTPADAPGPYPAALCVSINDEIVHGLPTEHKIVRKGDIVKLDLGLSYNGVFVDAARSVCAGSCDARGRELVAATVEALRGGIAAAKAGGTTEDIGAAIGRVARKYKLAVVHELGGHSLGRTPHEPPFVPNVGREGGGDVLKEGLVLAIEPIFAEKSGEMFLAPDGWTYKTRDRSRAAQTEATIIVGKDSADILTPF